MCIFRVTIYYQVDRLKYADKHLSGKRTSIRIDDHLRERSSAITAADNLDGYKMEVHRGDYREGMISD